jgi:hypothetical protein
LEKKRKKKEKRRTQAMKIGLWKFIPFDFDSIRWDTCMETVLLVCRVENHVIYRTAGESVSSCILRYFLFKNILK